VRQTANALVLAVLIAGTGLAAAEAPVAATQYPRTLPLRDAGFKSPGQSRSYCAQPPRLTDMRPH